MTLWWAVVFLAIFFIGLTKSGFGSGAGLMILPLTATAFAQMPDGAGPGAKAALPLLLPLLVAGDILAVWQYRKALSWRVVLRLLPGSFLGIILGSMLLGWFSRQKELAAALIDLEIGVESVFLVSLSWYRNWRAGHGTLVFRPSLVRSTAVGAFAGLSSTLAHAAGPIIALHLLPQRLERSVFVGTCAVYFFFVNTAKLPGYYASGLFTQMPLLQSLRFFPLVIAGALFGFWINRRMNDTVFSRVVYLITFALGWYILFRGANAAWAIYHTPAP